MLDGYDDTDDFEYSYQEQLIKKFQRADLFGSIIELGCAATVANTFMSVEGASKSIFSSFQPYSREIQDKLYSTEEKYRAISFENVSYILQMEYFRNRMQSNDRVNFCYVSSFQIQTKGSVILTHGWVGIKSEDKEEYYHISIPRKLNRTDYLEIIADLGIKILYSYFFTEEDIEKAYIDGVFDQSGSFNIKETLDILIKNESETFICIDRNKKFIRFEDLCRNCTGLLLTKGSFNPIHEGHIEIMQKAKEKYPLYNSAFFISIERFDKPNLTIEELLVKINKITSLGYNVVISKRAKFDSNVQWLNERWATLPILFPVGQDTLNRYVDNVIKFEKELHSDLRKLVWQDKQISEKKLPTLTIKELIENSFFRISNMWINRKFLVFNRLNYEISENIQYFKDIIEDDTSYRDYLGISSTKIRNGEMKTNI